MTLRNVPKSFTLEEQRQEVNEIAVDLDTAVDGVQTFGGDKTFTGDVTFSGTVAGGAGTILNEDSDFVVSAVEDLELRASNAGKQLYIAAHDDVIISSSFGSVLTRAQQGSKLIDSDSVIGDVSLSFVTSSGPNGSEERLVTTNAGVSVTGTLVASSFTGDLTGDVTGDVTGDLTGDVTGDVLDSNANVMVDISEGAVYADKVWATGLGSNTTGEVVTSYLVATSGMSYDAADPTNGIFLTPGSDVLAAVFTGDVTGDVTGDLTGNSYGTHTGQTNGDVYTADGGTQVVDTANEPNPIFKGDAEGLTGSPNIEVGTLDASGLATFDGNIILPDGTGTGTSGRLSLGDGADLRLYHDGTTTTNWIQSYGLMNLQSLGVTITSWNDLEKLADFNLNGSVDLYYDGAKKFETTNTGASVTGTLVASSFTGDLTGDVTGDVTANTVSSGSLTISGQSNSAVTGVTVGSTALDHYEEGSFTPIASTGYTSPTYTIQEGYYTRVGNLLYVTGVLSLSGGTGTGSGVQIGGMPFTSASPIGNGDAMVSVSGATSTASNQYIFGSISSNTTTIDLYHQTATAIIVVSGSDLGTGVLIRFSATYRV